MLQLFNLNNLKPQPFKTSLSQMAICKPINALWSISRITKHLNWVLSKCTRGFILWTHKWSEILFSYNFISLPNGWKFSELNNNTELSKFLAVTQNHTKQYHVIWHILINMEILWIIDNELLIYFLLNKNYPFCPTRTLLFICLPIVENLPKQIQSKFNVQVSQINQ